MRPRLHIDTGEWNGYYLEIADDPYAPWDVHELARKKGWLVDFTPRNLLAQVRKMWKEGRWDKK